MAIRWPHREQLRALIALGAAKPAYTLGLRAAVVTVFPLLLGEFTDQPALIWMAIGGWLGTLADPGGPYRARVATVGGFAFFGALLGALATLAGSAPAPIGLAALFATVFFTGLWRVRGDAQATVGLLLAVTFAIALGIPGIHTPPLAAALRAAFLFLGGLTALVLAIGLWPFQPYRPARLALGDCYRALARNLEGMRALLAAGEDRDGPWYELGKRDRPLARAALERARFALAEIRRGRQGVSDRGERLMLLFELGDLLLGDLSSLAETLRHLPKTAVRAILFALESISAALDAVAVQTEDERRRASPPAIAGFFSPGKDTSPELLSSIRLHLSTSLGIAGGLSPNAPAALSTSPANVSAASLSFEPPSPRPSILDALNPESEVLRHALRLALATTFGAWLGLMLGLPRAPWITVTILIVLQPQAGATLGKALQRVAGTMLGAIAAALLAPVSHHPLWYAALLFVLSLLAVALKPLSYGLFAALITPIFVLMAQQQAAGANYVSTRIITTLIGGFVALCFGIALWPSWERARLPAQIAALLRAERAMLEAAFTGTRTAARAARRTLGLALANAESSLQRFIGEPHDELQLQATMSLLVGSRRLAGLLITLAAPVENGSANPAAPPGDSKEAEPIRAALEGLAAAIAAGNSPPPLPPGISVNQLPPQGEPRAALLARISRQVALLYAAAARSRPT